MSSAHLEPRSVGALLDTGFRIFTRHALPLMLASALGAIPGLIAVLLTSSQWLSVLASIVGGLIALIVQLGVIRLAHETALGREVSLSDCISHASNRLGAAIAATILVVIVAALPWGLVLLVGIFNAGLGAGLSVVALALTVLFTIYLSLTIQVVVLEGLTLGALRRSRKLVRQHFWRLLGILAVFFFLGVVMALAMGATQLLSGQPSDPGAGGFAAAFIEKFTVTTIPGALVSLLSSAILIPVKIIVLTLLYIDIRVRKEGYDVEVLADELAEPGLR